MRDLLLCLSCCTLGAGLDGDGGRVLGARLDSASPSTLEFALGCGDEGVSIGTGLADELRGLPLGLRELAARCCSPVP